MFKFWSNNLIVKILKFYKSFVSPAFPSRCRFYPSCSEYTIQSVNKFGSIKGIFKGLGRILRCHPLHPGGYDPA